MSELPFEDRVVTAADGWRLGVADVRPPPGVPTRAIAIAGHAMLADRRTLWRPDRPCLAATLARAGIRVLVPDLRGRGTSGPTAAEGACWTYSDLIDDVGVLIAAARAAEPERPLAIIGHSLFGHVALARLGSVPREAEEVAGLVAIGVHIWNRRFEPSSLRWAAMRAVLVATDAAVGRYGYLPGRRLGIGSADESSGYYQDLRAWVVGNRWASRDGTVDYHANLAHLPFPVLHAISDGDRWYGRPDQAIRFSAPIPRRAVLRLGPGCEAPGLGALAPGHMALVTDPRVARVWDHVAAWIIAATRKAIVVETH